MRRRTSVFSVTAFWTVATSLTLATVASAQPDLPPPPPPPIGESSDVPSLPPPPAPSASSPHASTSPSRRVAPGPPVGRTRRRIALPAESIRPAREPPASLPTHPIAILWSPLGLFWGRLSASVEAGLLPHHAVVAAPNVLVFDADRGDAQALLSRGFGFATSTSGGFGVELGYHYWLESSRLLRGPFAGPSFLAGATSRAAVGDPSRIQGYWGLALDVGTREVLFGGLTAGVGVGVGLVRMSGVTAAIPRFLVDIGWSF